MKTEIQEYNAHQSDQHQVVCNKLANVIDRQLPEAESKIWHAHPVWFLNGNPVVGYAKLKAGMRLMFWSGADFDEPKLSAGTGKFKDAHIHYNDVAEIDEALLKSWLVKSREIQWNYKDIAKRKGKLERL